MDARQYELARLCREGWWRHAFMHDEWLESVGRSFPHDVKLIRAEVEGFESRVRLWYQLLICSAAIPALRPALGPYATALFSGATYESPTPTSEAVAQKTRLEVIQRRVFEAALCIASRGKMPTVEAIATEIKSTNKTVSKFGTGKEILLGAVAQLMHSL